MKSSIKTRVRVFCAQRNLTQGALAAQVGITAGHMSQVLSGKETPSLDVAVRLEQLTGIPAKDFASAERVA